MADREREKVQPWDSDHTALVHVLWAAQRDGLTVERADELAAHIMCSKWFRAVRQHAVEAEATPPAREAEKPCESDAPCDTDAERAAITPARCRTCEGLGGMLIESAGVVPCPSCGGTGHATKGTGL